MQSFQYYSNLIFRRFSVDMTARRKKHFRTETFIIHNLFHSMCRKGLTSIRVLQQIQIECATIFYIWHRTLL